MASWVRAWIGTKTLWRALRPDWWFIEALKYHLPNHRVHRTRQEQCAGDAERSPLAAKRLELLKEIVPRISRVLVLSYLVDPIAAPQVKELESAAHSLGVKLLVRDIRTADDLPAAFDAGARERAEGFLTTAESIFVVHRKRVVQLAAQHRLPGMYPYREMVEAGGLMSYGPTIADLYRRAATYVDKVLKGTTPADLPVEQPTKFEFVINSRTAKALGRTIPPVLLLRADQVIE